MSDRLARHRGIAALLVFSTIVLWMVTVVPHDYSEAVSDLDGDTCRFCQLDDGGPSAVPPLPAVVLVVWQCVGSAEPLAGRLSSTSPLVRLYPQRGPPLFFASQG